jgi:hypothetical protein
MKTMKTNENLSLESKLQKIGDLEERYGIVGVSFAVEDGETILTQEAADSVICAMERGAKLMSNIDKIPVSHDPKRLEAACCI